MPTQHRPTTEESPATATAARVFIYDYNVKLKKMLVSFYTSEMLVFGGERSL